MFRTRFMSPYTVTLFMLTGCLFSGGSGDGDEDDVDRFGLFGMSEERFSAAFGEKLCAEYESCNRDVDCDPSGMGSTIECDYDAAKAMECLNGDYTCNDEFGEGFEFIEVDLACMDIYTNCSGSTYSDDDDTYSSYDY